jgi:hypothetical protein
MTAGCQSRVLFATSLLKHFVPLLLLAVTALTNVNLDALFIGSEAV